MKIFIPCAGIGSRLEFLTRSINKSLVAINDKPAISHIIEKFSNEHTFVIALGYCGDTLRQFLTLAYPEYTFQFVEIENFSGPGSGLGLTLFSCKDFLQEPFIFIPTDSLFEEDASYLLNNPDCIFFSDLLDEEFQYRKIRVENGRLLELLNKNSRGLSYTGICHIHSYESFWKNVQQNEKFILEGESFVLNSLAKEIPIGCRKITWHDMGNLKSLSEVKKRYVSKYNILEKENEAIWFLKDKVIKYHSDKKFISNRVKRFKTLKEFVPNLIGSSDNMYCYQYKDGKTLSESFNLQTMEQLIKFLESFWFPKKTSDYNEFKLKCLSFYKDKTFQRLKLYQSVSQNDCSNINGIDVGSIETLMSKINWDEISDGVPSNFHGDLHFENILTNNDKFYLLDWRQDFEGSIEVGDIYYDFAKLNHGMIVAHDLIKKNMYTIEYQNSDSVYFDFCIKNINLLAQEFFFGFLESNNYDVEKVKILTALIFLNIAPLHHEPYNHMLYYLGKLQLHQVLGE